MENGHLIPVFSEIFSELSNRQITFWVFGGIAIAGIKGEFLRRNNDADIYILESDFSEAKLVLEKVCAKHSDWKICFSVLDNIRPKIEILAREKEIFSLIPVYKAGNVVKFIFPNGGSIDFSSDVLVPVKRKIEEFEFITPSDKYIKKLFENHRNLLIKRNYRGSHMENYEIDKAYLDSLNIEDV